MWVASWNGIDEIERLPPIQQIIMLTILFNGFGAHKIGILPEWQKMNGIYFIECALRTFAEMSDPKGSETHEQRAMVHFDNAPIRKMQRI
jgi:hypothetical protein